MGHLAALSLLHLGLLHLGLPHWVLPHWGGGRAAPKETGILPWRGPGNRFSQGVHLFRAYNPGNAS